MRAHTTASVGPHSATARRRHPLAAAIVLALAVTPAAHAATIVVTSSADPGTTSTCTLRQAIVSMNTSTLSGNCQNSGAAFGTGDTINFATNVNTITLADAPQNSLVVYDYDLEINAGAGRNVLIQRPANAANPFEVIAGETGRRIGPGDFRPGSLRLVGLTIQNGVSTKHLAKYGVGVYVTQVLTSGGAVAAMLTDVTLDRCVVRNNRADVGGGVGVKHGQLTIRNSTISDNVANYWAGGVYTLDGMIQIRDSTVSQNAANGQGGGGAIGSVYGGLQLVNSTVSGNTAIYNGSAVTLVTPSAPMSLLNSTLACNDSATGSGAIVVVDGRYTSLNAASTILANTSNSRCTTTRTTKELLVQNRQLAVAGGNNLVIGSAALDSSATFASPLYFGDPQLGPLQNNGGATATHALPAGSPAINRGSNPANLATDQRGGDFSRVTGASADIGAYEYPYAGLCGTAHGRSFISLGSGSPNLCATGAFLQDNTVFGSGPWSWFCAATANPNNNEFCGAKVLANVGISVINSAGTPISSAVYGQPTRLRATVSGAAGTPGGTVVFFDSTSAYLPLCSGIAVSGGSATCEIPAGFVPVGTRLLNLQYGGDATYGAVTANGVLLSVQPATTTTTVASHDPTATVGAPYVVTAQVTVNAPSVAPPLGIVTIADTTDQLDCSYDLAAAAPGCAITPVSAGTHQFAVAFGGNPNLTSSSATLTQTVARAASTTTLTTPAPIAYGQSVTLLASVSGGTAGTPTGTVEIGDGHVSCSFDPSSASGCTLTPLDFGTRTLSATYSGDVRFQDSSAGATLQVVPHTIGGSVNGLLPGRSLTLRLTAGAGHEDLPLSANGGFTFGSIVPYGLAYAVSLAAAPVDETCAIANASGTMPATDVGGIVVTCVDRIFGNGFDP